MSWQDVNTSNINHKNVVLSEQSKLQTWQKELNNLKTKTFLWKPEALFLFVVGLKLNDYWCTADVIIS